MLRNNYFIMFYHFFFCKKIYEIFCVLGKVICIDYNSYSIKIFARGLKHILELHTNNLAFDVEPFPFISRHIASFMIIIIVWRNRQVIFTGIDHCRFEGYPKLLQSFLQ